MTGRKRWRPPWPVQAIGTLGVIVALGFAVDGFGWAISAVVGWVTR